MKTSSFSALLVASLVSGVLVQTTSAATKYLDPYGSFKPDGTADAPYKYLKQAAQFSVAGDTLAMYAGKYNRERLEVPRRYEKFGSGVARIETPGLIRSTLFTATHLNCHLSYCGSFIDNWADETRSEWIAAATYGIPNNERPDFQGFCEIWNNYSFPDYINNETYAYYPMIYGRQGTDHATDIEHSGLAMRSNYDVTGYTQHVYTEQVSPDSYAHKGWLSGTLTKDGIAIHVIVTHTQANDDQSSRNARAAQLAELQRYIVTYRESHPHIPVIAMGDFNVVGDGRYITDAGTVQSAEYPVFASAMRNGGIYRCYGIDAAMNLVGGLPPFQVPSYTYHTTANTLVHYFNPEYNASWDGRLDYFLCYDSSDGKVSVVPAKYRVVPLYSDTTIDECVCGNCIYSHADTNLSDHYAIYGQFVVDERN